MEGKGFFLFVGNGGGVELAYDDGDFTVPGIDGKPARIRFPASAPDPEPAPKPAVIPEPAPDAASEAPPEATPEAPPEAAIEAESVDVTDGADKEEVLEKEIQEKDTQEKDTQKKETTKKRAVDFDDDDIF